MEERIRTAILTIKSPFQVEGGSDVRMLGMIRALSLFSEVHVIPIFGENQNEQIEANIFQIESSGLQSPANHELFRNLKERPSDPYSIFSSDYVRSYVTRALDSAKATHVIANRLTMWRILQDIEPSRILRRILDLDESAHRLHDSFTDKATSSLPWKLHADFHSKVATYEESVVNSKVTLLVSSLLEANVVKRFANELTDVHLIQHVVLDDRDSKFVGESFESQSIKRILFPANFAYPPNRAALEEIVKEIAPALPEFEFRIAGFSLNMKEEWKLANLSSQSPVNDMETEFLNSDILIVPLRWGAGTRVKVLEAMKYGLPVIATEFAVEGLGLTSGVHYLSAESPEEFRASILRLSKDLELAETLRLNAAKLVKDKFAVTSIAQKLREVLLN